jgi:hypothetical protein
LFGSPFDLLQMNVVLLFAETDQTILFQGRHKKFVKPMNELEIFRCGIPTVEQNCLRFNVWFFEGSCGVKRN